MNIAIMRAFVEIRKILLKGNDLKEQLKEIKERLGEHDVQLSQIYDAMENLLDEKRVFSFGISNFTNTFVITGNKNV